MMSGHTPEPWTTEYNDFGDWYINHEHGKDEEAPGVIGTIGKTYCEENARRVVACVNACEGIDDEVLEGARRGIDGFKKQIAELESERDQYKRLSDALAETINDPEGRLATLQKQRDELLEVVNSLRGAAMDMAEMVSYKYGDYLTAHEARSIERAREVIKSSYKEAR